MWTIECWCVTGRDENLFSAWAWIEVGIYGGEHPNALPPVNNKARFASEEHATEAMTLLMKRTGRNWGYRVKEV